MVFIFTISAPLHCFVSRYTFPVSFYFFLLLLSQFSRVQLCVTPQTAAHQAPQSLGFSWQEHWSGLLFPSPVHESEKSKWSHSVTYNSQRPHGLQPTRLFHPWIVQARVLEWLPLPSPPPSGYWRITLVPLPQRTSSFQHSSARPGTGTALQSSWDLEMGGTFTGRATTSEM